MTKSEGVVCVIEEMRVYFGKLIAMIKKSDYWLLGAAFVSFCLSVGLWFSGQKEEGMYVGIWVPSILAAGGYFKQMTK